MVGEIVDMLVVVHWSFCTEVRDGNILFWVSMRAIQALLVIWCGACAIENPRPLLLVSGMPVDGGFVVLHSCYRYCNHTLTVVVLMQCRCFLQRILEFLCSTSTLVRFLFLLALVMVWLMCSSQFIRSFR